MVFILEFFQEAFRTPYHLILTLIPNPNLNQTYPVVPSLTGLITRGGGFRVTDKWYTGILKGFEVHFRKFWYIDGWVIATHPMRPICKIGCILENLAKKAPNLPQIGCFLQKNGIEVGHKITLFEV